MKDNPNNPKTRLGAGSVPAAANDNEITTAFVEIISPGGSVQSAACRLICQRRPLQEDAGMVDMAARGWREQL